MRLRNVPGAREVMVENEYVFTEPEGMCGTWKEVFGNDNPIHIQIGMGKGTFITTLAGMNPDINYVGIEKYSTLPSFLSILSYLAKNCLDVSLLLACLSFGHGSEKLRYILSTSSTPNTSLIFSASILINLKLGSCNSSCFSTALNSTLEYFYIPT